MKSRLKKMICTYWVYVMIFAVLMAFGYALSEAIDNAGGFRGIVVSVGKEIKQIGREIAED